MDKEVKNNDLMVHEKSEAAFPKKMEDEPSEESCPAPRCPDNYCFEVGM